jgi:hypothetical protein
VLVGSFAFPIAAAMAASVLSATVISPATPSTSAVNT